MPINYQNGKIYQIWSPSNPDLVYVGSTTQSLSKRLGKHKTSWKMWKKGKHHYTTSFRIFEECDDYKIELIQLCPCNSKIELERAEGKYIRELECINKFVAGRTKKEYYEETKEKELQRKKEYYQENREQILEKTREYYQANKERVKAKNRRLYQENREQILEKTREHYQRNKAIKKDYYQRNKERISQKVTCECGRVVRKDSTAKHRRSKIHNKLIASFS